MAKIELSHPIKFGERTIDVIELEENPPVSIYDDLPADSTQITLKHIRLLVANWAKLPPQIVGQIRTSDFAKIREALDSFLPTTRTSDGTESPD